MKIIYVTLNSNKEAEMIGRFLLENDLANCVNYFPITCVYKYKGEITKEPEVVLIIKTQENKYEEIKEGIKSQIDYDNFIGQFQVDKVNDDFKTWLDNVVK